MTVRSATFKLNTDGRDICWYYILLHDVAWYRCHTALLHYLRCESNAWQVLPIIHPRTPPSVLGNRGSSGLSLKEAFQIWRAVNHVPHMTDRLVDKSPDFIVRDAKPAFTKRIVLRQNIAIIEHNLIKKIEERS